MHRLSAEAPLSRRSCRGATRALCPLLAGLRARLLRSARQRTVRLPVLRRPATERAAGAPDEMDNDGKNADGRVEISTDSREYCNVWLRIAHCSKRRSLTGELSLRCARPMTGNHLGYMGKQSVSANSAFHPFVVDR